MCRIVVHVCLLGLFLQALTQPAAASEFSLDGDFLIGGLFDIHQISDTFFQDRSETITCSRWVIFSGFDPF